MRGDHSRLHALLEPAVTALGYELVGVELLRGPRRSTLRLYIDREAGIGLDDCERVSHQVSGVLDVEDPVPGEYSLEVSSPGLDRPLFKPEHFERFVGQRIRVKLDVPLEGRRKFTGELLGYRAGRVLIREDGVERELSFDDIGSARLVPEV